EQVDLLVGHKGGLIDARAQAVVVVESVEDAVERDRALALGDLEVGHGVGKRADEVAQHERDERKATLLCAEGGDDGWRAGRAGAWLLDKLIEARRAAAARIRTARDRRVAPAPARFRASTEGQERTPEWRRASASTTYQSP